MSFCVSVLTLVRQFQVGRPSWRRGVRLQKETLAMNNIKVSDDRKRQRNMTITISIACSILR